MTNVRDLLTEQTLTESLLVTNEAVEDTADMVDEALAEALDLEQPSEDDTINSLQFHNQDHLAGLTATDLTDLNPDNTEHLNKSGRGGAVISSFGGAVSAAELTESLVTGSPSVEELDDIEDDIEDDTDLEDDIDADDFAAI